MKKRLAAFSVFFVFLALHANEEFFLVKDGKPAAGFTEIPSGTEKHVVAFNDSIRRCTGVKLPLSAGEGNRITLTVEPRIPEREDSFEITFPDAKTMNIRGSVLSVRWALNRLLEDYAGVRFVMPRARGTYCPEKKNIAIPRRNIRDDSTGFQLYRYLFAEDPEWALNLNGKGVQSEEFFNHGLGNLFPPEKYAKEPWLSKIMPLRNGSRIVPKNKLVGWQPCFSNPECVSEAVKNICALLEKEPERKYVSLGVNDIGCFYECGNCRKANGGKSSSFMRYQDCSTIYYHWLNKVVSEVDKKYPGRLYGVVAYREVIRPPEFKLHPNIVPFITLDIHQELSPKRRTENHKLVEAWGQVARHIGIWEYFFMARDYSIPRLTPAIHADAFRFATSKNAGALFIETGSYSGDAVKRYLAYKLAFHPELEPWRIIQDWCDAAVGKKAGKFLKEYYESCEKFWTSDEVRQTSWFTPGTTYFKRGMMRSYLYALPDGKLEEWRSMMEKMLAAAKEDGNADQCYRAEKLFDFFKFHEAVAYGGGGGLIPVGGKFTGAGEVMAMLEKLPGAMEYSSGFHTVFQKIASDRFNGNFNTDTLSEYTRTGAIFFNALLPWRNNPAVREKGFATAARPDVGAELRNKLRDTLDFDRKKNLIPDLPDELEKKEWRISYKGVKVAIEQEDGKKRIKVLQPSPSTWLAARRLLPLESRKTYALEVKAWSPFGTESQMSSRIILGGGKEILSSSFEESSEFYKPCQGKRITMTLVANTPNNCRYGWAYVIWNGLGPDEFFFIESMKLVEIGTGVEAK